MRALRFLKNTPCALLLAAQLIALLAYPFLDDTFIGRSLLAVFGLLVLILTVIAVRNTPTLWWVSVTLAVPALLLLAVQAATANSDLVPYSAGFEAALYFYAAFSMIRYMLADDKVTTDEMFAIATVFTLLAWAFAYVYVVLQAVDPGAFTDSPDPEAARTWVELLYLSFTTLSSTGMSDVIPLSGHARSIGMIEQVAGVFYIAMIVTRLVGLNALKVGSKR